MICDQRGNPLHFTISGGNINDCTAFDSCFASGLKRLSALNLRQRVKTLLADRGYDSNHILSLCRQESIVPVIPPRQVWNGGNRINPDFEPETYKKRNVVERCFAWLKECRRVSSRFEKLASTYHAIVVLACMRKYLRTCCS